jgi:hypothetical protein
VLRLMEYVELHADAGRGACLKTWARDRLR